jgi:hypothetical protein
VITPEGFRQRPIGHEQAVGPLADGKRKDILIAADGSGAVRFWNLAKGEEIRSFQAHEKGQRLDALAVGMSVPPIHAGAVLVWDWKRLRRSFEDDPLGE